MDDYENLKKDYIIPLFSIPLAVILGMMVVCFVGCCFFSSFLYNPLIPIIMYSYTLHPLCRYKLNYQKAYPNGWGEIILRLIWAHVFTLPLVFLKNIGSSLSQ